MQKHQIGVKLQFRVTQRANGTTILLNVGNDGDQRIQRVAVAPVGGVLHRLAKAAAKAGEIVTAQLLAANAQQGVLTEGRAQLSLNGGRYNPSP